MNNKLYLKRTIVISIIVFFFFIIIILLINQNNYNKIRKNNNEKIASIIYIVKEKYPEITDEEIARLLNFNDKTYDLSKYGILIDEESVAHNNDKIEQKIIILNITILFLFFVVISYIHINHLKNNKSRINDINKMIEEISEGNYELDFQNKSEDELSILRDNLYKIVLKLKEDANNSLKDKKNIKEDLENISHQLKTPLTAITISLDNILDNEKIDESKKREFLVDIKREISNINNLIKNLLELSRFDVNVVKFDLKENNMLTIIKESIKRVELLSEVKNIEIITKGKKETIICDYNWEIEAITNIIKNAVEHSNNNKKVLVELNKNNVYLSIKIINDGTIDKEDLENIFKRFYKGKNSIKNSTGIGLSLSKSIIEKDNGKIFVKCDKNKTIFEIKYYIN